MAHEHTALRTPAVERRPVAAAAMARSGAAAAPSAAKGLQQRLGNQATQALISRSALMRSPDPATAISTAASGRSIMRECACAGACKTSSTTASEMIHRKADRAHTGVDYAGLARRTHGSGQPLDSTARTLMESRFGHSFDRVRTHTDAYASHQAQALDASAFTIGQDVFFGNGRYRPDTRDGQRLLAHELTHTLQQRDHAAASNDAFGSQAVSHPSDALEQEADRIADSVVSGDVVSVHGAADGAAIHRDLSLPSLGDLKRGAEAVIDTGKGLVKKGAQAVEGAVEAAEEAIEWIATEAGKLALAEANALASLFGGSVIIRKGCLVISIPEVRVFPSFQKTLAESPPVGFFIPLLEGGVMLGPIPIVGMAGLLGYAQVSAEAAVGPGVVRGIQFELCPLSRRVMATAQLYAAAAIAPRLTLFGGAFGAIGTLIPFTPPIPIVVILQGGLRGTGTGWAIGAVQDTVKVEYRAGTIHFSNIAELMLGYLLQGDLDLFAALRLYSKIICQYVHPIGHWETGRAWKLTIPVKASYGPGGGTGGVGPITWGPMPIGGIQTAIRPLPAGWNCLSWEEIKQFLCDNKVLPPSLCQDEDGAGDLKKKTVKATIICKCVGEEACGGGKRYLICYETQKDCKRAQKDGDNACNNNSEMKKKCIRPKCYYRHSKPDCPVDCEPGTITPLAVETADCPIPVNYRQTSASDVGGGTLHFEYAWDSSTGALADLSDCKVTEKVDYPNGDPFKWPSPPWNGDATPNPTITPNPPYPGTRGKAVDNHSTFGFKKPYERASFTAKQVYRYTTPCKNGGKPLALSPNISIVRAVTKKPDGNFKYRITKSGSAAEVDPLP